MIVELGFIVLGVVTWYILIVQLYHNIHDTTVTGDNSTTTDNKRQ